MKSPPRPHGDESERWLERPVFVTGLMKSGTTLFLALLDGHDELLVYPDEPSFTRLYGRAYRDLDDLVRDFLFGTPNPLHFNRQVQAEILAPLGFSPRDWRPVPASPRLDALDKRALAENVELRGTEPGAHGFSVTAYHARLERELARLESADPRGAVLATGRALLAGSGRHEAPRRWLFKQPLPAYRESTFESFFRDFPEGRLVVLLRDPRAFLVSLMDDLEREGPRRWSALRERRFFLARLATLERDYRAFSSAPKRFGEERVILLRYEDFITETRAEMTRLSRFLGVSFEESMLTPSKAGGRVQVPTATREDGDRVYAASLTRYRQKLGRAQLAMIDASLHGLFGAPGFDYTRETSPALARALRAPVRLASRLAAALRPLTPPGAPK